MVPDTLERVPEMQDTPPCPHSKQHSGATLEFSTAESLNMSRKNKVASPMRWRNIDAYRRSKIHTAGKTIVFRRPHELYCARVKVPCPHSTLPQAAFTLINGSVAHLRAF